MAQSEKTSEYVMRQCVIGGAGQPSSSGLYDLDWYSVFEQIVGCGSLPFGADIDVWLETYPIRPSLLNGKRSRLTSDLNDAPPGLYMVKDSVLSGRDSVFLMSVHDAEDYDEALNTLRRWALFQVRRDQGNIILSRAKETLIICAPWSSFFK